MNQDTNWGPRSLTTLRGTPCSRNTRSRRIRAAPSPVRSIPIPSINVCLVNLSMMTRMALCPRERGRANNIPGDDRPGPLGNGVRVGGGSMLGQDGLHPLTCLTPTDIPFSIFHHVHPPVGFQESTLHLPRTRVPSSREVMFMAENTLPYICRHPCDAAISP